MFSCGSEDIEFRLQTVVFRDQSRRKSDFFLLQWSVLLPVVLTLIATQENGSGFLKRIQNLCYTKWALEAFVIANAQRFEFSTSFNISS